MLWIAIAAGGALGSLARHAVNVAFTHFLGRAVPFATAMVNIVGSLTIGALAGLLASGRLHMSVTTQAFVFVGILGGFTTFSSFMLDVFTLAQGGQSTLAIGNLAVQVGVGLLAVYTGYFTATLGRG